MKKLLLLFLFILQLKINAQELSYQLPLKHDKVDNPIISLNGIWQFQFDENSNWENVIVPGELVMQGYGIEHDKAYDYKKSFLVPESFKGQRIILRFDGVYSEAELSINGKFIRKHNGGFTRWETDIADYVQIGKENLIELKVTDRLNDISYASGYAHHPIGGILRDVTLFATPKISLTDFNYEIDLDDNYVNGHIDISFFQETTNNSIVEYSLIDPQGDKVSLESNKFKLKSGFNFNSLTVKNPKKWDAEHPNLYKLLVEVKRKGKLEYSFIKKVGFREVKVVKDQFLVNGSPIKLRGANRHDIHPKLGRVSTAEYDKLDVQLFKESHINFVRTSHYPPTERFVEYCDEQGIYVEVETAVCFVDTYRQKNYAPGASQDDSTFTEQYISQCREMVNTFKSHPSVIIWSIGNESIYGKNFQKSFDFVKSKDKSRPIIWSYPGSQKEGNKIYEILSMHYQDVYGNLSQFGMSTKNFQGHGIPALFDEWAHPACYTYQTLRNDPNIREFWGLSMEKMWGGLFPTQGGLGGAIWGYVDEVFYIPKELKKGSPYWKEFSKTAKPVDFQGSAVGYGEWGIVDVWRRKKPEFWSTKKAHSPIRVLIEGNSIKEFKKTEDLVLPIYNRFDHTNLNEISLKYKYLDREKSIELTSLQPHSKGEIVIPAEEWKNGEPLLLSFVDKNGLEIDTYKYYFGSKPIEFPLTTNKQQFELQETEDLIMVKGNGLIIPISKTSGLIENAKINGKQFISKGPFLNLDINLNHLSGAEVRKIADNYKVKVADWKKTKLDVKIENKVVKINIEGNYKELRVAFDISINPNGEIKTSYKSEGEPNGYLREMGLKYYLSDNFNRLKWSRNGLWNYYPDDEFAGNEGDVAFYNPDQAEYGLQPRNIWHKDTHNYYYWSDKGAGSRKPLTQESKGMKENIYHYSLFEGNNRLISVISEQGDVACRLDRLENEQLILFSNNKWDYPEIAWGNYCKMLEANPCRGEIILRF